MGHEPDGEQQGHDPLARARIEQEHAAAHDSTASRRPWAGGIPDRAVPDRPDRPDG